MSHSHRVIPWFHNFIPQRNALQKTSLTKQQPQGPIFRCKFMATVFFDCEDVLYIAFMTIGITITAEHEYSKTLQNLKKIIRDHRYRKLNNGILLLHNTAKPHITLNTQMLL